MSDNNKVPWTVFAASGHAGETLQTIEAIANAGLTREQHNKALECDARIVFRWLTGNLPSGTMDRVRAYLLGNVPDGAVLVTLPHSEVCMHMGVAGVGMFAVPIDEGMAQLYTLAGEKFSAPITRGEAGLSAY